jgi:hypothetical protein
MARPAGAGRPRVSQRDDKAVKIDRKVVGWAEWVARARGITTAQYLSDLLHDQVRREYGKCMKQMSEEGEG